MKEKLSLPLVLVAFAMAYFVAKHTGAGERTSLVHIVDYPDNSLYSIGLSVGESGSLHQVGIFKWVDTKNGKWVPQSAFFGKEEAVRIIWDGHKGTMIGLEETVIAIRKLDES